jgi:uncharacterized coiled-coil DUF342 family protein
MDAHEFLMSINWNGKDEVELDGFVIKKKDIERGNKEGYIEYLEKKYKDNKLEPKNYEWLFSRIKYLEKELTFFKNTLSEVANYGDKVWFDIIMGLEHWK